MKEEDKALAVGHIPSGLFIVCANTRPHIQGFLASWIQQVSFDPLLISLAVKSDRPITKAIYSGDVFTVNVVGESRDFLKYFWGKAIDDPFSEISHFFTPNKGVAIKKAKSWMDCRFVEKVSPGDHDLLIARVLASGVQDESGKPMIHIRKTGRDY